MFLPVNAHSLGLFRFVAGIILTLDLFLEREFFTLVNRYDKDKCFFTIHPELPVLTDTNLTLFLYVLLLAHVGITLGLFYRVSTIITSLGRWYLMAIDMTRWNNHTYFFALMCTMFVFTDYHAQFSFSARRNYVPEWQLWIVQYQQFIIYFMAGIQKVLSGTWLQGKSSFRYRDVEKLPFMNFTRTVLVLEEEETLIMIHWCGLALELGGAIALFHRNTRWIAILFLSMFHSMNFYMFDIGMFPVMCVAGLTLFLDPDWCEFFKHGKKNVVYRVRRSRFTKCMLVLYTTSQLLITFSDKVFVGMQGYHGNGLYGFSWKMFTVGERKRRLEILLTIDGERWDIDPRDYMNYSRRSKWKDNPWLIKKFASCIYDTLDLSYVYFNATNIHLYMDVTVSYNGGPESPIIDMNSNLFFVEWNLFKRSEFIIPIK